MDRRRLALGRAKLGRAVLGRAVLTVLPLAFLAYFFVYPVGRILLMSAGGGWGNLNTPRLAGTVWFTFWQASVSTVATLLLAMPLTWALSRVSLPGRRTFTALVTVPFVLPTVVVGSAFVALGWTGSVWAILAAHIFYNVAVVVRLVGGVWSRLDPTIWEASAVLGARPARRFWNVTLPLLRPALAAAAAIVFVFSFTSFGVVLILGQLRYRTLEVAIYEAATSFLDLPSAAALSVLQLACVALLLATAGRLSNRLAPPRLTTSLASPRRSRRTAGIVVAVSFGLLAVPLLALARRSVGGFSALATQPTGLGSPLAAVANSLRTAALAAVLATLVGLPLARMGAGRRWGRAIDLLVMLPLGTSAVTVGLGFLVALGEPVDLRTSPLLIPIAHSLVAVPFVVRATGPLLSAIRPAIREAAAVLGANRQQVWTTIERPIVARAAALGGGMAAAVSLGEFGASAFIVRPESTTLPVLIARLLARPGAVNFSAAMALAVVLMGVTGLLVLAVDRLGEPRW